MIDCLPNVEATACARCGWVKPAKIKGWPRRNCAEPITEEEIARRRGICLVCEHWTLDGCGLIPAFEREHLTEYKLRHGHCAAGCKRGVRRW